MNFCFFCEIAAKNYIMYKKFYFDKNRMEKIFMLLWKGLNMDYLKVFISSISSLVIMFLITRLVGKKQISELNIFDYSIGITIGSIAAEMATRIEGDVWHSVIALVTYGIFSCLLAIAETKSIKLRKFFTGKAMVVYEDGKLYNENLKKAKLDLNQFLTQCRKNGYFDLSQLKTVVFETNGSLSFLPKGNEKPLTPKDMNLKIADESLLANVIIDGKIMYNCLKFTGNDENWLKENLKKQNASQISEIFLATCDSNNNLKVYKKVDSQIHKHIFE